MKKIILNSFIILSVVIILLSINQIQANQTAWDDFKNKDLSIDNNTLKQAESLEECKEWANSNTETDICICIFSDSTQNIK